MLIKNIALCVQTVVIIIMAVNLDLMSGYADRALKLANQSEANAQTAIIEAKKAHLNADKAIEISQKYQEKIAWYEKKYGIVMMPGERREFTYNIPLK